MKCSSRSAKRDSDIRRTKGTRQLLLTEFLKRLLRGSVLGIDLLLTHTFPYFYPLNWKRLCQSDAF